MRDSTKELYTTNLEPQLRQILHTSRRPRAELCFLGWRRRKQEPGATKNGTDVVVCFMLWCANRTPCARDRVLEYESFSYGARYLVFFVYTWE